MQRRMSVGILALSLLGCHTTTPTVPLPPASGPASGDSAVVAPAPNPPVTSPASPAPASQPSGAAASTASPATTSPAVASPTAAPAAAAPAPASVAAAPVQTKKPVPVASSKAARDKDSALRTAAVPTATQSTAARADKTPVANAQAATTPALDLAALEQRLRDTHAIGVFSKLSLKNQVDDLLAQFKAFYGGQARTSLTELRQRYDLLLLKVLSLLQDGDPPLASAISTSREAIWGVLADRDKFQKILSS
jgi:hypothetical protein